MEKDDGKRTEEGLQRQPRKKLKTAPQKQQKTPRELRFDSFADSMDRSSSESSEDEEEATPAVVPATEGLPPPPKRKRKFKPLLIPLSRTLTCPDMVRVDRCNRVPEYGPEILFFSGGSALRDLSGVLKDYTHNSIHLITPFDSGGSTAEIRRAFPISAVGDLRNRLIALSDQSALGNPAVINFFSMRLNEDSTKAHAEFESILQGKEPLVKAVKMPMRSLLRRHLQWFSNRMPTDFNLCGASIGNLIITGCWLEHDKDIVAALYILWNLLGVKGKVRPITGAHLHLRTQYDNGDEDVGQHLMGKRKPPQKIKSIDLVKSLEDGTTTTRQETKLCHLDFVSSELIASCDLVVFPMGSFFGSMLANLLPVGVGKAIHRCQAPKIYIPNTGVDPEMHGYTLSELITCIVSMVEDDLPRGVKEEDKPPEDDTVDPSDIVNFVLVDTENCHYCVPIDKEVIEAMGIVVMDMPLVNLEAAKHSKSPTIDPTKLAQVLLTLGS
ncbi:unnamed protein product [Cylindrotheca closterium]|uniref:Uncharacterized protein n=1 Tax=Cylindrotheca closterium TaxID=2856 RepID=A0AAD2G7U4_9STRA|nr:unnamed protein product [Cylindrotheca closterium]